MRRSSGKRPRLEHMEVLPNNSIQRIVLRIVADAGRYGSKMIMITRLLTITSLSCILAACAGVGVFVPEKTYPPVHWALNGKDVNYTKDEVRKGWRIGNIDPVISGNEAKEVWTYRYNNDWCGALLVVIPLMLPVCRKEDVYYFEGERLIKHEASSTKFQGVMCSIFPACSSGSDCTLCITE